MLYCCNPCTSAIALVQRRLVGRRMCFGTRSSVSTTPMQVSTYRRERIPTSAKEDPTQQQLLLQRLPLSITDLHLRHEQLPFAYFFTETLCEEALHQSLQHILSQQYPLTGGTLLLTNKNTFHSHIQCQPNDTLHVSYGTINMTLEEWQSQPRGHEHTTTTSGNTTQHPTLLPIFDSLFTEHHSTPSFSLAKIRITYFQGGGTAIGVNFSHLLADTASCIQFVQSWGQQMRNKHKNRTTTSTFDRSQACVSGMMTPDMADLMGLNHTRKTTTSLPYSLLQDFHTILHTWFRGTEKKRGTIAPETKSLPHEYVRLAFPPPLLQRLKEMGSHSCRNQQLDTHHPPSSDTISFVSTNDMLTSFGWLMKRHLSQNNNYGLSMVFNLRGRSELVDPHFFGNGISHVVATQPSTECFFRTNDNEAGGDSATADDDIVHCFYHTLCSGAHSIRGALQSGLADLPQALAASRSGRPLVSESTAHSFSTTNWAQFPLYQNIRFTEHGVLTGFHGHPSYPLPPGRVFASVIVPCPEGGVWYELLLPSDQAQQARDLHSKMTSLCMRWEEERPSKQTTNQRIQQ